MNSTNKQGDNRDRRNLSQHSHRSRSRDGGKIGVDQRAFDRLRLRSRSKASLVDVESSGESVATRSNAQAKRSRVQLDSAETVRARSSSVPPRRKSRGRSPDRFAHKTRARSSVVDKDGSQASPTKGKDDSRASLEVAKDDSRSSQKVAKDDTRSSRNVAKDDSKSSQMAAIFDSRFSQMVAKRQS
jgi:hypothetical protein